MTDGLTVSEVGGVLSNLCRPKMAAAPPTPHPLRHNLLLEGAVPPVVRSAEFVALKHKSRIFGHSYNPLNGFSMMEQVRLCAV